MPHTIRLEEIRVLVAFEDNGATPPAKTVLDYLPDDLDERIEYFGVDVALRVLSVVAVPADYAILAPREE